MNCSARSLVAYAVLAATALVAHAAPAGALLTFDGAIGVDPLTAAGGSDQLNVVRGINPGGRAWVIRKLDAAIYADGSAVVRGKGLLFASGDLIGTVGPVTQVVATLACGAADASATKYTTEAAPLNAAGNFNLQSVLRDAAGNVAPLQSMPCANPKLLLRASATGGWFAVGIPADADD
jgi:hypothetical protein